MSMIKEGFDILDSIKRPSTVIDLGAALEAANKRIDAIPKLTEIDKFDVGNSHEIHAIAANVDQLRNGAGQK